MKWEYYNLKRNKKVVSATFNAVPQQQVTWLFQVFKHVQKLVIRLSSHHEQALSVNELPTALRHLELFNVPLAYDAKPYMKHILPETLTYLQSNLPFDPGNRLLTFKMLPAIRHLDVPWWNFCVSGLSRWTDKGMDKLSAHLYGFKDVEWTDFFLTTKFHPKTLANMSVSLTFTHTGRLLPTNGPASITSANVNERRRASQIALAIQLQSAFVNFEISCTPSGKKARLIKRPVSRTVHEMFVDLEESPKFE